MADKMMRLAGRGDDGTAKALSTNNEGNLRTSKVVDTKRFRLNEDLQPGGYMEVINTTKEIVLHSLVVHFTNDQFHGESFSVAFGSHESDRLPYTALATSDLVVAGGYTSTLIPSICLYDKMFEVVANEPNRRIVVNRNELHVKGLQIYVRNSPNAEQANNIKILGFYSEVE